VLRAAGSATLVMTALGALASGFNAGVIAVVHRAIENGTERGTLGLAFLGLCLGKVLSAYVSGRVADSYSQESMTELRREVMRKLLAVPYRDFERIGSARALAALTTDIAVLHSALELTASATVNAAVLIGGALYLCYLSWQALVAMLLLCAAGFAVYRTMSRHTRALLVQAREQNSRLYGYFESLTAGMSELKLNAARRKALLDGPLLTTTESILSLGMHAHARHLFAQSANSALVLGAIGFVLFLLPVEPGDHAKVVSGYVLTGLYLVGPLSALLRLLPAYTAAGIALQRIEEIGVRLGEANDEPSADPADRPEFASIELRDVVLRYDEQRAFALGPIDFALQPGELVLITGGNGSGKSTLAKLLVGLYAPDGGTVLWNGRAVQSAERDRYRQLFSVVLSEFYVFDRLYGLDQNDVDARAHAWLARLGLANVVQVEHGTLSSRDVSRGQRKRLALLTVLLEDRPVYVLDEWAADQDSEFKEIFYRQLLPELKRRGKTLVIISHDERFYGLADRRIHLADGRVAETSATGHS
jgi:putative pyoverdin transport system ATP-binding/permease protein